MLKEETTSDTSNDDSNQDPSEFVFFVKNDPVMQNAVDLIPHFGKSSKIILKARGNSIPNAVAIANILSEKFLKGNAEIQKIIVDSEIGQEMGRMISSIEITISKK